MAMLFVSNHLRRLLVPHQNQGLPHLRWVKWGQHSAVRHGELELSANAEAQRECVSKLQILGIYMAVVGSLRWNRQG